jgi:hypothetical protein
VTTFDYRALWQALEARRGELGISKTAMVNDIAWVSAGVIKNLEQGKPTSCQHATGLLRWLGRTPESFVPGAEDSGACALPDVGPFAIRWSMQKLWDGVDAQREERGLSWDDVATQLEWPGVKTFARDITYGIPMDLAMRVTQWIGAPAATFMIAAEPAPDGVVSRTWGTAD